MPRRRRRIAKNRKPGLIQKAVEAKLFKSFYIDRLFDDDPLYEATNLKGMLHLSWATVAEAPINWRPAVIRRADGLYRPPLTKIKLLLPLDLHKFLEGQPDDALKTAGLESLQSEGGTKTLQRAVQKGQSGEHMVKALQALPKLSSYHVVLCYKDVDDVVSFGIIASPRRVQLLETPDPLDISDQSFPYLWGDSLKHWIEDSLRPGPPPSPPTVWDRVLDEDLFPHSHR